MGSSLVKIKKAYEDDWNEILEILDATKLSKWFTGGEDYKKFFYVDDPASGRIVSCFQLHQEGEVAILRSFAIRPELHGQGTGLLIINDMLPPLVMSLGIKRLYARGNNVGDFKTNGFWEKTIFKHIKNDEIKDKIFKDDMESTIDQYGPDEFFPESAFYLDVENL